MIGLFKKDNMKPITNDIPDGMYWVKSGNSQRILAIKLEKGFIRGDHNAFFPIQERDYLKGLTHYETQTDNNNIR